MALEHYIFNDAEINLVIEAFDTLKAKRPYNGKDKPRDRDFREVYKYSYKDDLASLPSSFVNDIVFFVTEDEWSNFWDLFDRSLFATSFAAWVKTVVSESPLTPATGPTLAGVIGSFGNEDPPEQNQVTILASILAHHEFTPEQTYAVLKLLRTVPPKKFAAACASLQTATRELLRDGNVVRIGMDSDIDWAQTETLKYLSIGNLASRLPRITRDVIVVGGHSLPDALFRAGVLTVKECPHHAGKAHLFIDENEVAIDEYERLEDPDMGRVIASYLTQATGTTYEYSHTDTSDLKLGMNVGIFYARKPVDGRVVLDPTAVSAHRATASHSVSYTIKKSVAQYQDQLASIYAKFAANVAAANPQQLVWSPPGRDAANYMIEYVKDRNLFPEELRQKALACILKLEEHIKRARQLYDQGVADVIGHMSHCGRPCYQSVHLKHFDPGMFAVLNNKMRSVADLGRPTVQGDVVLELTMSKLVGVNASLKEAMGFVAWQMSTKADVKPTPVVDFSPNGLRAGLTASRRGIRISEGDKTDGSNNLRLLMSGLADCEIGFSYSTISARQIEFANLLDQLGYCDYAMAVLTNVIKGGAPGGGPGVLVYDDSPFYPFMSAVVAKMGMSEVACYANMQVYSVSGEVGKHRAPLLCRTPIAPHAIPAGSGVGKVLVMGDSWIGIPPNSGLDLTKPQEQIIDVASRAKFTTVLMQCRLDAEWQARRSSAERRLAVPPEILLKAARHWKTVYFVPGLRPHNGMFWMVCHGLREKEVVHAASDVDWRLTIDNWKAFYAGFAIAMIRGNVLKDLYTMLGVYAPHSSNEAIKAAFYPHVSAIPGCYNSVSTDLQAWGFRVRGAAAISHILNEETEIAEDYYGDVIVATTGELSSVSYVSPQPPPVPKGAVVGYAKGAYRDHSGDDGGDGAHDEKGKEADEGDA